GIYIEAWDKHTYNIDVFNNTVHDISDADGFTLASEVGGLLENIHLYNNIAYNNDFNGLTFSNADSSPTPVTHPIEDCTVINNTFFNNGSDVWGGGIHNENPESKNIIIRNNIFSDNRHYQILLEVEGQNFTIDHNLIHGFRGSQEGETYGSEYVAEDPLFRNPAGADFHLQAGSPAVDSGSAQGAPADDFDGNIRPQGVGVDIGAYEFTLVVPVSVSPMTALPSIIMPLLLSE
ncbi:MAG TPA: hypothetical protein DDW42_03825, partial [Desulfobacteraceae bacterium]|nr:hypothetical protein [Desulfobacteraceae bacterium]